MAKFKVRQRVIVIKQAPNGADVDKGVEGVIEKITQDGKHHSSSEYHVVFDPCIFKGNDKGEVRWYMRDSGIAVTEDQLNWFTRMLRRIKNVY